MDLFLNAIVSGVLLGAFYAAVAVGLAITFGQLDIVNIAHPAFVVVGSYITWILNSRFGLDPVLVGVLAAPVFFFVGALLYRIYYAAFERTGQESLSGLAFFFGVMFIVEVILILVYGVDYRLVSAGYLGENLDIGFIGLPLRLFVPFVALQQLAAAAEAAGRLGFPFMLAARAENHIRGNPDVNDTIARLQAYEKAGADVLYAPGLRSVEEIRAVCKAVGKPVYELLGGRVHERLRGYTYIYAEPGDPTDVYMDPELAAARAAAWRA